MKLFYCPSYTGFVYADLKSIMFNAKIVDTPSLVEEIKLHAGMCSERKEDLERTVDYYRAMKSYLDRNPSCVLKSSFDVDGLSAARECLLWRDTLTFAGWNRHVESPSERIKALAGIEEFFSDPSLGEELKSLTDAVKNGCTLPEDLEIETALDWKLFSPLEIELLEALEKRGVSVGIKEIPKKKESSLSRILDILDSPHEKSESIEFDGSFKILHFEEQDESLRYLSLCQPDDYDLWINSDCKAFDDWLYLEGKAVSGSRIKGALPQIPQLLAIGLGTLENPLNLKNMIEWLDVPLSPLKASLRKKLEHAVSRKGGYYNCECRKIIEEYIECKDEIPDPDDPDSEKKLKEKSRKRRNDVEKFLPDINAPENGCDGNVSVEKAMTFAKSLYDWCSSQIAIIDDELKRAQLALVKNECAAVILMLESEGEKKIPFIKLMSFVSGFKSGVDMLQYEAEEGCRTIVSNPGRIFSPARNLIWCDFYDEENEKLKYDFLTPVEKKAFKSALKLWDEEVERNYNHAIKMIPFRLADKVTLVTVDRKLMEDVEKHPLYIQLENEIQNLSDFISEPKIEDEFPSLMKEASVIDNRMKADVSGININRKDLVKWPEFETYTSLDLLVYNPLDYALKRLANISSSGISSIPAVSTSCGTVAHGVIEKLFNRREGIESSGTIPYIRERIKNDFDSVFSETLNASGAVLLLKENQLNMQNYKSKVFDCVNGLLKVIEENGLHVLACEPYLENDGLNFEGGINIGGFADMILADRDGNPVVFDFKWSPGNEKKYIELIEKNESIQLELYRHICKNLAGAEAKSVAYVILPEVAVISARKFNGENTYRVSVENMDEDVLAKIRNSYAYRRKQISEGFIEEATGFPPELIDYQNDCESENLMPLQFDGKKNPKKIPKPYPEYEFFKMRI
ncbi:MAG: hypothetical protein IIU46_00395 [Treponema sp.]|nr:hypothetical protein [Treponema sp.]